MVTLSTREASKHPSPSPLRGLTWVLTAALTAAGVDACLVERSDAPGDSFHPAGFANPKSTDFHGSFLASHGFPLGDCRACHGDDYKGGFVGVSCDKAGCHEKGVESCTTCHGSPPKTGAHQGHPVSCTECHPSRSDARSPGHPDGVVDIAFGPIASSNGSHPVFDPQAKSCSDVDCHGGRTMQWTPQPALGCDGCHGNPPPTHAQFATSLSDCSSCHGDMSTHIDGKVDVLPIGCDTCHGKGPLGAPPPGLLGTTSSPAVGAHASHLDASLPNRIGRVAHCQDCHVVPASVAAPQHIDSSAPADVTLKNDESYDQASRGCVVGCHWDRVPGPRWDDTSGAALACDACHAFPPIKTRGGATHPPAASNLSTCLTCHAFDPATHVDGKVDF